MDKTLDATEPLNDQNAPVTSLVPVRDFSMRSRYGRKNGGRTLIAAATELIRSLINFKLARNDFQNSLTRFAVPKGIALDGRADRAIGS